MADSKLFEAEALAWVDTVYRVALSLCAQPSLADDLVQSTYLKAWERFDQFAPGSNCRAWLLTILRNTWVDHLRQRGQAAWTSSEALEHVPARAEKADPPRWDQADGLVEQFDDPKLAAAFSALPDDFRLAVFLVDIEGYSHDEAAAILGVAAGTIKSRTSRARRTIRERLTEAGGREGGAASRAELAEEDRT